MKGHSYLSIALAVLALTWSCVQAVFAQENGGELRDSLLLRVEASKKAAMQGISLRYHERLTKYETDKPQHELIYLVQCQHQGNRFILRRYASEADYSAGSADSVAVSDGNRVLSYFGAHGNTDDPSVPGKAVVSPADDTFDPVFRDNYLTFLGYHFQCDPEAALLSPSTKIDTTLQKVDGVSAYEVRQLLKVNKQDVAVNFWLAPDFSANPVKIELWVDGRIVVEREYGEFQKLENGVWFPTTYTEKAMNGAGGISSITEVSVDSVSSHPDLSSETFDTDLSQVPIDYVIDDRISGLHYIRGQGLVSDDAVTEIVQDMKVEVPGSFPSTDRAQAGKEEHYSAPSAPSTSTEPQASAVTRHTGRLLDGAHLTAGVCLGCVILAAIGVLIRKRFRVK